MNKTIIFLALSFASFSTISELFLDCAFGRNEKNLRNSPKKKAQLRDVSILNKKEASEFPPFQSQKTDIANDQKIRSFLRKNRYKLIPYLLGELPFEMTKELILNRDPLLTDSFVKEFAEVTKEMLAENREKFNSEIFRERIRNFIKTQKKEIFSFYMESGKLPKDFLDNFNKNKIVLSQNFCNEHRMYNYDFPNHSWKTCKPSILGKPSNLMNVWKVNYYMDSETSIEIILESQHPFNEFRVKSTKISETPDENYSDLYSVKEFYNFPLNALYALGSIFWAYKKKTFTPIISWIGMHVFMKKSLHLPMTLSPFYHLLQSTFSQNPEKNSLLDRISETLKALRSKNSENISTFDILHGPMDYLFNEILEPIFLGAFWPIVAASVIEAYKTWCHYDQKLGLLTKTDTVISDLHLKYLKFIPKTFSLATSLTGFFALNHFMINGWNGWKNEASLLSRIYFLIHSSAALGASLDFERKVLGTRDEIYRDDLKEEKNIPHVRK